MESLIFVKMCHSEDNWPHSDIVKTFYFKMILDLLQSCKNSTEFSCIFYTASYNVQILYIIIQWSNPGN